MCDEVIFFKTPVDFRDWLSKNYDKKEIQWLGYYKMRTGKPGLQWEESVREALCFGWSDGLTKSIDEESYKVRFSPIKPYSFWSDKNITLAEELLSEGKMEKPGLHVFETRKHVKAKNTSNPRGRIKLKKEYLEQIRQNAAAWAYFKELTPSSLKATIQWVMSAKNEKTRLRRLKILIESSEKGEKVPPLNFWG